MMACARGGTARLFPSGTSARGAGTAHPLGRRSRAASARANRTGPLSPPPRRAPARAGARVISAAAPLSSECAPLARPPAPRGRRAAARPAPPVPLWVPAPPPPPLPSPPYEPRPLLCTPPSPCGRRPCPPTRGRAARASRPHPLFVLMRRPRGPRASRAALGRPDARLDGR
ncbi:MAG: hypothetical protein J3K34DRAFT_398326, partial [Monoraphidium minutum]